MKDYLKLTLVFLLFFASIFLAVGGMAPPLFGYALCLVVLPFGILAIKKHKTKYSKTMLTVSIII